MRRITVILMLVLVASAAVPAAGGEVVIERALSKTVKMYASPDGKGGSKERLSKEQFNDLIGSAGGQLKAVQQGLMLKVTIEGKERWIEARTVKLSGISGKLKIRCAEGSAPPAVAATRGMEDQVECK